MSPKTAFITGVNGITGSAICTWLVKNTNSSEWEKIYVTSRSEPTLAATDDRVEFIALDFMKTPAELVKEMKSSCATVTHAFFSSYVHKEKLSDLSAANKGIFENFLEALIQTAPKLENVLLQTGGKYYNAMDRVVPVPCRESDPRLVSDEENFYYPQEDFLAKKQAGSNWSWSVIRPVAIVGYVPKPNGMNEAMSMAVYFHVCKELGIEAKLLTNELYWNTFEDMSYAPLIADLSIYVSTHKNCANEAFNMNNGDVIHWRHFWPRLAGEFGAKASSDQKFSKPLPKVGEFQQEMTYSEFFKDKKDVWLKVCKDSGMDAKKAEAAWKYVGPDLMDWPFRRTWGNALSMNKAKKFGWMGYIDSFDCFVETWDEYKKAGLLPN